MCGHHARVEELAVEPGEQRHRVGSLAQPVAGGTGPQLERRHVVVERSRRALLGERGFRGGNTVAEAQEVKGVGIGGEQIAIAAPKQV